MIYKLKLDLLKKVLPFVIEGDENKTIVNNIINGRRTHMSFQKAVLKCDAITGDNVSGMVEAYEEVQASKKEEAAYYSDEA
jgi:hypothetical protein